MTKLSPAAQAVLDAFLYGWPDSPLNPDRHCLAVALCAVADQFFTDWDGMCCAEHLKSIATELEGVGGGGVSAPITLWRLFRGEIKQVECTRVTDCRVWPAENRWGLYVARRSSFWSYHETWADAHQALLDAAALKLDYCRRDLKEAQGDYGRMKGMKPPADAEAQP